MFELGLRKEVEEKSCDIAGARFWRLGFGEEGGDVAEARVEKWEFLNGVRNLSWCWDIERRNLQATLLKKNGEGLEGGTTRDGFGDGENVGVN